MCVAKSDVRFTLDSDRESEILQKAMSALPPKADMCVALAHVCFGPKADIAAGSAYSISGASFSCRQRFAAPCAGCSVHQFAEAATKLFV